MRKRIINKEDYPPVLDWSEYKDTHTLLPCKCVDCGEIVKVSIEKLDQRGGPRCKKCGHKRGSKKQTLPVNKSDFSMVDDWSTFENTQSRVKCRCQICNDIVFKTFSILKKNKLCLCNKCAKIKREETNFKKYGVRNVMQSEIVKSKFNHNSLNKKGVETKRKNGTLNTSKMEKKCCQLLSQLYFESDIKRNYNKDSRYPFCTDFYIISEDLFIECNFHWTHGKEPYLPRKKTHKQILSEWKKKNTKFYQIAIDVWTNRDVKKIKTAKENNLNYLTFYSMKEFEKWYESKKTGF